MALDDVELWVKTRYGPITYQSVEFPQFGWTVTAACVPVMGGIQIGMGQSRQLAVHDLYLALAPEGDLKTSLPPWWAVRRAKLHSNELQQAAEAGEE